MSDYPASINFGDMASAVIIGLGEDVDVITSSGVKTSTRAVITESLEDYPDGFDTQTRDKRMEASLLRSDVPMVAPGDHIHAAVRVYTVVIVDESDEDVYRCIVSVA